MSKPDLTTRIKWSIKRRGLLNTLRLAVLKPPRSLASWFWDAVHRVDTARLADLEELEIPGENVAQGIRYQPTPVGAFRKMIGSLGIRHEDFNFIDFGSGKGRTLLLAAEYPFNSISGVEFAPDLHAAALRNIQTFRGIRRCSRIHSFCQDAATYRLPLANSIVYFNFPFREPVMQAVLDMLHACLKNTTIEIIIVNYEPNPATTRLLGAYPAWHVVTQGREYAVYRSGQHGHSEKVDSAARHRDAIKAVVD